MSKVSEFTNDNFRALAHLYDAMDATKLVKITQQELSDELGISRVTANKIFKQLRDNGYISQDTTRVGRYYVTESGANIVETFRKTDR